MVLVTQFAMDEDTIFSRKNGHILTVNYMVFYLCRFSKHFNDKLLRVQFHFLHSLQNLKHDTMTPNITTLALNLLISERESQRILFSGRILEALQSSGSVFKSAPELMDNFVSAMKACIEKPHGGSRDEFYKLAAYCDERIASQPNLSSAA